MKGGYGFELGETRRGIGGEEKRGGKGRGIEELEGSEGIEGEGSICFILHLH